MAFRILMFKKEKGKLVKEITREKEEDNYNDTDRAVSIKFSLIIC